MSCIFSRPAHRTFHPAPVYPQVSFNVFGEPVYEGYAPGSGLSPYGDRDLYLYALAAKRQQQRQEEYAYAVALAQQQQEERQRRREGYELALALEERRHKAAVRQSAERHFLAQFAREAERHEATRITKAKAEQEARLEEYERRRRASLEQARRRQSALVFLNALFSQDAETDNEEKHSKGKGREVPISHYTPENVTQSQLQPQRQPTPVQVDVNVAGPSNSQQTGSAPAPPSPSRSISAISSIEHEFTTLRDSFTFPATLDFSPSSSPVPQLAYNSTNLPLRVYEQELTNLLTKLDEADSEGVQSVRDARKKLVGDIEQVLEEMDKRKEEAWEKTVVSHKDVEVSAEDPKPEAEVVARADEELESAEVENIVARADEELEFVDAPVDEGVSSVTQYTEPASPQTSSGVVGYDVSPAPEPSPIVVDSTLAIATDEAPLFNTTTDTSVLISSEASSRTATPSPFDAPTPIDTIVLSHGDKVAQPTADEDMQSSSDEEEERVVDDGVVLTAEDDGTLITEEVEHGSESGSDFEML